MKKHLLVVLAIFVFLLVGCAAPAGTPAPSATPAAVAIDVATATPTTTSTPEPTTTFQPTSIPTPLPTLPTSASIIGIDNAARLSELASYGKGAILSAVRMQKEDMVAIHTAAGVYVYDSSTWSEVMAWPGALSMAFDDAHVQIAVGLGRGEAEVWNYEAEQILAVHQGYDSQAAKRWSFGWKSYYVQQELEGKLLLPDAIVLDRLGIKLILAGRDSRVGVWDLAVGKADHEAFQLAEMTSDVAGPQRDASLSFDGTRLATLDEYGSDVMVWNIADGKVVVKIPNAGHFSDHPFSPDNSRLVTYIPDIDTVQVWDLPSGKRVDKWSVGIVPASPAYSRDGHYVIINDYDQIRRASDGMLQPDSTLPKEEAWPAIDYSSLLTRDFVPGQITGMEYFADTGRLIAWGTSEHGDYLWGMREATIEQFQPLSAPFHPGGYSFGNHAVAPDGKTEIVSGNTLLMLRNTADQSVLHNLAGHAQFPIQVRFSPSGKLVASGSAAPRNQDNEVILWSLEPLTRKWTVVGGYGPILSLAFSPDESILATGSNVISLWRTSDHWQLGAIRQYNIAALAFSPDSTLLAAGSSWDNTITIYNVKTLAPLVVLRGHLDGISALAFTEDGRILLSGSADGTVRWWGVPPA